ncbi:MAG: DUF47 domain-containing protein [Candidatus Thorarchaeota archaeon]
MGTFSRIFGSGNKDLQKKADVILLKMSKALQSASAKLCVSAKEWVKGEYEILKELEKEIIEIERETDLLKEDLVENILTQHAYMPQVSEERHSLVNLMDSIIDAAENAVRVIAIGDGVKPPTEIADLAKKCWECTDLLQDAVKYLFKDFKKSIKMTRKLDVVREEARDIQFELLKKLCVKSDYNHNELLLFHIASEQILKVAIKAELAGDFIRELAVKYS